MTAWLQAHRALRVILMAVLFPVPVANLLSGSLAALVSQQTGWRNGALDSLLALGLLAALVALSGGLWWVAAAGAAALWGGAVMGGQMIGRHGSMTLACQTLVALAFCGVVLANLLVPDPQALWQPLLERVVSSAGIPGFEGAPAEWFGEIARLMHGLIGASLLSSILMSLFFGSWLASRAGGHGFREMFLRITMGRALALLTVLVLLLGVAGRAAAAGNLLLVLGTGLALQGLSVVHWVGNRRHWPSAWPVALYVPLLLSPPLAGIELLLLAVLGFVDNGYNLRRARPDVV